MLFCMHQCSGVTGRGTCAFLRNGNVGNHETVLKLSGKYNRCKTTVAILLSRSRPDHTNQIEFRAIFTLTHRIRILDILRCIGTFAQTPKERSRTQRLSTPERRRFVMRKDRRRLKEVKRNKKMNIIENKKISYNSTDNCRKMKKVCRMALVALWHSLLID